MNILSVVTSVAVIFIDQVLKFFSRSNFKYSESFSLIDGLLNFVYLENRGAAFGIFKNARWFFVVLNTIMLVVFVVFVFKKALNSIILSLSTALVVGGGVSNLIDRICFGYVIDYLELSFFPPVCNFADYCISVGAVLFIIYFLFSRNKLVAKGII
ncbi:MAG: signal peptidase II [Oscillospiraceae bacterium]|nr:signal peptidase II [Oscillospiraceae bacterium]